MMLNVFGKLSGLTYDHTNVWERGKLMLPPVMQIAIDEELWSTDSAYALKQRIAADGLMEELKRQGEWSLEQYEYVDSRVLESGEISSGPEFSVTPTGTLNPFSPVGKCFGPKCAISTLDKTAPQLADIEDWERLRTIPLPWIQTLTCEEVLALREEASKALPRLRELLRSQLTVPTDNNKRMDEVVAELRSQALEVEAELDALKLPKERRFRGGMSGLAVSFVIYAFASQSPQIIAGGLVALLATLAHLRNTERDHDAQATKLTSKPAYALLKAKQIIQNRTRA